MATAEVWVDYRSANGHFVGGGNDVECERVDDRWAVWSVNQCRNDDGTCGNGDAQSLTLVARATHDVSTPAGLTECRFVGQRLPRAHDFKVEVTDATDEFLRSVSPQPRVEVTDIRCQSTSSTTSTTIERDDPCDRISCSDDEICIDGSCEAATRYAVEVHATADQTFGALQLEVLYDCEDGGFDGERDQVHCIGNSDLNASILFNDYGCDSVLGSPRVVMSFVTLHGFDGPVPLAACEYTSATGLAPSPGSFPVRVVDASAPDLSSIDPSTVATSIVVRPIAR